MEWQLGSGELSTFGSKGHVVFQAFSGATPYGYVAIDDVKVDDSVNCPVHGETRGRQVTTLDI